MKRVPTAASQFSRDVAELLDEYSPAGKKTGVHMHVGAAEKIRAHRGVDITTTSASPGALVFDTAAGQMKMFNGTDWIVISS